MTGLRDFSLLRNSVLFVVGYGLIKQLVYRLIDPVVDGWLSARGDRLPRSGESGGAPTVFSSLLGGGIGGVTGLGRGLVLVAALFIFTTLFPQTPVAGYIQASSLYQKGAKEVIQPVTGDFLANQLPVFTRAVEQEFSNILQRKYEVLDARIAPDIAQAARQVTAKAKTDEEKAKLLYRWSARGSRTTGTKSSFTRNSASGRSRRPRIHSVREKASASTSPGCMPSWPVPSGSM